MTKAEDEGVRHNAHDEVAHYHTLFMMEWSSDGMSWKEAREDDEKRKKYNELLYQKGRPPILTK